MAKPTVNSNDMSDGESTASSADIDIPAPPIERPPAKRKRTADFEERVVWTDESEQEEKKPKLSAKRQTVSKRRTTRTATGTGKAKRKSNAPANLPARDNDAADESSAYDGFSEARIPDYLRARRNKFIRDVARLREAALKLPPDYSDLYFSDDDARLERRPNFANTGIKPSRPYEDTELKHSAGVIPACIAQYLRPYQIEGVDFLHQCFVYQKGCILGDDMGLGKTIQVAAFLTAAFGKTGDERDMKRMRKMRRAGDGDRWYPRVLIVCPGSLIQNWKNELNRWGWWNIEMFHGPGREDVLNAAKAGRVEIMITTYRTYEGSREAVNAVEWDCVVADECHLMKDRRSATTKSMEEVNSLCRIGLTGTAIQNKYAELWTLLNWTNPGRFGTLAEWDTLITKPLTIGQAHGAGEKDVGLARLVANALVKNVLPGFFLRRTKALIANELPKKRDKVVFCPLTGIQRKAYENFLVGDEVTLINTISDPCPCGSENAKGWCCYQSLPEPDGRSWKSLMFPCIMTLQKIANNLTLLIPGQSSGKPNDQERHKSELRSLKSCLPDGWGDLYRNRESILSLSNPDYCGKWNILQKLLEYWHSNGDKVLIFSHSVRLLKTMQHLFNNTHYNVSYLDGKLDYEARQTVVDNFNTDPSQFVFLISTKAGGVGLNITSANKVVIFDPHWNPSYDLQAQDRAFRIGQTRDVDVFRLVSAGTIEEIVYARQIFKQQQSNIGYSASSERRYFTGEIFGLKSIFKSHGDQVVVHKIINDTNIAETKLGIILAELDLGREKTAEDDEDDEFKLIKMVDEGGGDESVIEQMAEQIILENNKEEQRPKKARKSMERPVSKPPDSDAAVVAAILNDAGVTYTHENSEVIGTSKEEAEYSRLAELMAVTGKSLGLGDEPIFAHHGEADEDHDTTCGAEDGGGKALRMHYKFRPPEEVKRRQFCSMAREFGFADAASFALVVESWTQEQRRNCLDGFYKRREMKLLEAELGEIKRLEEEEEEEGKAVKVEEGKAAGVAVKVEEVEDEVGMGAEMDGEREREGGDVYIKKEEPDASARPAWPMQVAAETVGGKKASVVFLDDDDEEDDEL
ncbi:P-loop containing nucleoside triphosphate hydrolase protein [Cercophora scortea]|uniref:P-loop containing nucleoside triphosphate hydrolase protein n=1 Tax=Cercophora scortea TaxID=314031 RepID=A0AAE0ILP9_9PEZI|nr:P-loop containing nucleoside triphosphate hydrolase protein [Cercophora scortea]